MEHQLTRLGQARLEQLLRAVERRREFTELPKTISGKIRRVQLRATEHQSGRTKGASEFWEENVL